MFAFGDVDPYNHDFSRSSRITQVRVNVSVASPSSAFPRPPRSRYQSIQRYLVTLLLCLVSAAAAKAQDPMRGWQWQNPLPQGNSINSIRFTPDKRHGWATGGDGVVLRTTNGGFDWEPQET